MNNKLKFTTVFILMFAVSICFLSAETVYLDELKTASDGNDIVFKNYSGPHNKIDTIEEIRGIGGYLGRNVDRSPDKFNFFGKYRVIHAVDYNVDKGLDADIFILEKTAAVDHIDNLRRIISGYLESAYGYDKEQSDLLAEFITIYNAVHRSDMEYFTINYKDVVTANLKAPSAGLALSYLEWPGNTMMVIPLTPRAGTDVIADLDTDILSDDEVIEKLRSEEDRGIEKRQDLVELMDDEVDEQRKEIEKAREEIEKQEEKLEERETELKKEIESADEPEKVKEIEEELAEIDEQKEKIEEKRVEIEEKEQKIEEREEKILEERDKITEDQSAEIAEEAKEQKKEIQSTNLAEKKPRVIPVPFLKVSGDPGSYTGQLVLVDTVGGSIIKRSEIDSIRLRGYSYEKNSIVSVAGSTGGTRIISLVKIDPATLDITETATVEVYYDSAVFQADGKIYAVVKENSKWKIGIFDNKLRLISISSVEVFPATDIVAGSEHVIAQDPFGSIIKIPSEDFIDPAF